MAGKQGHRSWGWLRHSGRQRIKRWHASYIGPDKARHKAPATFGTKIDAEGWLASERRLIDLKVWTPPAQREAARMAAGITLADYAPTWIKQRTVNGEPLRPRTKIQYERIFEQHIKPTSLAQIPLSSITTDAIRAWHATALRQPRLPRPGVWTAPRGTSHRGHRRAPAVQSCPDTRRRQRRHQAAKRDPGCRRSWATRRRHRRTI
jgi:hypothetical protein